VKTKDDLAKASLSKRATTIFMLMRPSSTHELKDEYKSLSAEIIEVHPYME